MSDWEDVEYVPDQWEDVEYEPSTSESLYKTLEQGLTQATRGLELGGLGLLDYGFDAMGYENNGFDDLIAKRKAEKLADRYAEIKGTGYETASDIIEQAAPVLGASIATGGMATPALVGLSKGFADQYEESRAAGRNFNDASTDAGIRGLGEGVSNAIESIPLIGGAKQLGRLGRLAKAGLYGSAGNVLSDASDIAADSQFKTENNIPKRLSGSALLGATMGVGMGTISEGVRGLGAKSLNQIDDSFDEAKIREFDDLNADVPVTQFNPEAIPPATPSDNLSSENFPTIQQAPVTDYPNGFNPEITPQGDLNKGTLVDDAEIPILESSPVASDNGVYILDKGNLTPAPKPIIEPLEGFTARTPQDVDSAAPEIEVLQNTDGYRPYAEVITPENILSDTPANFVKQRQSEILASPLPKPITQMPERPLSRSEIKTVEPTTPSPKKLAPIAKKGSEYESPIQRTESNSSVDVPSLTHTNPSTQQVIRLPFDENVKARTESLITDSDEVTKALRNARRNSQRGSLNIFAGDPTPTNVSKAPRTKDAAQYDPDGIASVATKPVRQWFEMFRTTAEKHPEVMPVYRAYSEGIPRQFGTHLLKLRETGSAYFDLPAKQRESVNALLQAQRRKGVDATPEYMAAKGFDQNQINAALSVRKMMEESLDIMTDAWKVKTINRSDISEGDKTDLINAIDTYASGLRGKGYVPDMRFGEHFVEVRDAKGNLKEYAFRDSAGEAKKLADERGKSDPSLKVTHGKREVIPDEVYNDLPADLGGYLFFLDGKRPTNLPKGVMGNFVQARNIEGADKDLTRSLATYIQGISKYSARAHHEPAVTKAVNALNETNPHLAKKTEKYIDDLKSPQKGLGSKLWNDYLVPIYNFQYLSGNVSNITLNALEPVMSTYPQIGAHLRDIPNGQWFAPERIAVKSAADAMLAPLANKDWNPDLRLAIDYAKQSGFLDDSVMKEIYDLAKGRQSAPFIAAKKINEVVGYGNRKVEDLVKYYDYVTGYNVAKARGLVGKDAFDYAMYFTNDVKSSGRKTEQNQLFRNVPVVSLFRNYAANQLRQFNRSVRTSDYATLGRQMLPLFGIAGVQGLPYAKEILSGYDMYSGEGDWKASVRDGLNKLGASSKVADAIIYGTPAATTGWVYSNTAGFANVLSPDEGKDFASRLGKTLLGATAAPFTQYTRYSELNESGLPLMALERMAPVSVKQALKAYRTHNEGVTDASGNKIKPKSETILSDIIAAGTNTNTLDTAKRYEANSLSRKMDERATNKIRKLNDRLFNSLLGRNSESPDELIAEMSKLGLTSKALRSGLKTRLEKYQNATLPNVKRLPKSQREEYLRREMLIGN